MANYIKENNDIFKNDLSKYGRNYVTETVFKYADLRNSFIHKNNITDWNTITEIRGKTYSIIYLMLGSFNISTEEKNKLGYSSYNNTSEFATGAERKRPAIRKENTMGFAGGLFSGALAYTTIVLIRSCSFNAALAEALDRSYLRDGEEEDDIITVKGEKYKRKEFISRAQEVIIENYRGKFASGTYDKMLSKYKKKYEKLKGSGPKSKEEYYRTLVDICTVLSRTARREDLDEKWKAFFEAEKQKQEAGARRALRNEK